MTTASVAELVAEMHADEMRGIEDVRGRYLELVRKAASGKPLSPEEAKTAAACAFEMKLPADRFDTDAGIVRGEQSLAAMIERDKVAKAESPAKGDAYRARLIAIEKERREIEAAMQRMQGEAILRSQRLVEHARMLKDNPHLFKPVDEITDADWKAVRA